MGKPVRGQQALLDSRKLSCVLVKVRFKTTTRLMEITNLHTAGTLVETEQFPMLIYCKVCVKTGHVLPSVRCSMSSKCSTYYVMRN